jgi:hypothetical protein
MDTIVSRVNAEINRIYERDGMVKPSVLVEESEPVEAPAHEAFEWDNIKAGKEYRLMQARGYIRHAVVTCEGKTSEYCHIPASVEYSESKEGSYKPIHAIVHNKDEYRLALAQLASYLDAAQESYNRLVDAAKHKHIKLNTNKIEKGFSMIKEALA